MAKPSFTVRILKVVLALQDGSSVTFDGTPQSYTPFVPGFQIEADIENVLLPAPGGTAFIRIFGLSLSHINQLSIAGRLWRPGTAIASVYAGDSSSTNLTLIHSGYVIEAKPEFAGMPSVPFFIHSLPGLMLEMNNKVSPTSFNGTVSHSTALKAVSDKAGVQYADHSTAPAQLSNFYTSGSAMDQMNEITSAAKKRGTFSLDQGLKTFEQTGSIPGAVATIRPENGMIGYPDFQEAYVSVRTIFDPEIADVAQGPGHQVKIQSQLTAASGTFVLTQMRYNLSCNNPAGGPWEIDITAINPALGASGT